jgi:anti-sigma regulatory factor (Ser/Thr protein kinase)
LLYRTVDDPFALTGLAWHALGWGGGAMIGPVAAAEPVEHLGLLYRNDEEYAAGCAAFVRRGLQAGQPVLVSVPAANGAVLRRALDPRESRRIRFFDMREAGRNPGRIIPGVLLQFAARNEGTRVWIVGEPIWPGRTPMEYPACAAHEALINVAFHGRDAAILCPYDVAGLDAEMVADAWSTHPIMIDGIATRTSDRYGDPVATAEWFNRPLPPPPHDAARFPFSSGEQLSGLRRAVGRHAAAAGLDPEGVSDVQIAVNELTTNSLEHSPRREGVLRLWREPGLFVCQVDDGGHLADPMAGRRPGPPGAPSGHGLVLVNHLVDLLRVHTAPGGTSLRVHKRTPS